MFKFPLRIFFERFLIHLQKKYFCLEKFKDEPFQSTDSSYCCSNVKSSVIPMACIVSELVWNSGLLGSEPSYLWGWSSTNPVSQVSTQTLSYSSFAWYLSSYMSGFYHLFKPLLQCSIFQEAFSDLCSLGECFPVSEISQVFISECIYSFQPCGSVFLSSSFLFIMRLLAPWEQSPFLFYFQVGQSMLIIC